MEATEPETELGTDKRSSDPRDYPSNRTMSASMATTGALIAITANHHTRGWMDWAAIVALAAALAVLARQHVPPQGFTKSQWWCALAMILLAILWRTA